MRWAAFDFVGQLKNGTEEQIPPDQEVPFSFSDAATMAMRRVRRERGFQFGERLQLTARELSEIVFAVRLAARQIRDSTVAWAAAKGNVTVVKPKPAAKDKPAAAASS